MTITLYRNTSEPHKVTKSLSTIKTLSGTLKDATSIIDPTIVIESDVNIGNYMYIAEFNRFYYITDIVSVSNSLWEISGHVDVLMSFKSEFLPLNAIIARQENQYNLYLDDDKFLVDCTRIYWTKAFPNRSPVGGSSLVLTLAGGAESAPST